MKTEINDLYKDARMYVMGYRGLNVNNNSFGVSNERGLWVLGEIWCLHKTCTDNIHDLTKRMCHRINKGHLSWSCMKVFSFFLLKCI